MRSSRFETETWRSLLAQDRLWGSTLIAIGFLAAGIAAAITAVCPHFPREHDEFCNLLAADTLLHGRLANPTPEVWEPLQTYHVIFQPSYAAKYPLANAILIAGGMLLFGAASAGSWIAAGLCASSLTWMAAGVVTRRWAAFCGLLVALHPSMQCTWSQSLFGGWLTAAGAALLMGGVLRLRRRVSVSYGLMAGTGVAILALSRPFEGLVFTGCCAMILLFSWRESFTTRIRKSLTCACYAVGPIACSLLLIGLQNEATTGSYFRMPYQVHEAQYGAAPLFVFGQAKAPDLLASGQMPAAVERYHLGWSLSSFTDRRGMLGWFQGLARSAWMTYGFWGMSLALAPFTLAPFVLQYRLGRLMLAAFLLQVCASASVCWIFPHYLAPLLVWLFLFLAIGIRIGWGNVRGRLSGLKSMGSLPQMVVWTQLAILCLAALQLAYRPHNEWAKRRAEVADWLAMQPGQHLVVVQYDEKHNVHQEWVFNRADIARAKIVWARGEREEWLRDLLQEYGASHQCWTFNPDQQDWPSPLEVRPPEGDRMEHPAGKQAPDSSAVTLNAQRHP